MSTDDAIATITRLLNDKHFHTEREAEKVRQILISEFPGMTFSLKIDWEAIRPELKAEMVTEIINQKNFTNGSQSY